ncbi:hypothetical protein FBU30_000842 [Linnemannia zychae]|nr:hypothetical protein FBU30_000842 [Linnemannia zychae]
MPEPILSVSAVPLATVVSGAEAHNSDPEPIMGDVEKYLEDQHQLLQSNRLAQEGRPGSSRLQLSTKPGSEMCIPGTTESDMSCSSSLRKSSDNDTLETEDDYKGVLGSDSNDTDSILDDAMALEKRCLLKTVCYPGLASLIYYSDYG